MLGHKTLIFIPTYNESENVRMIFGQIKNLDLDTDMLFLDDNSPDGTGQVIDAIAKEHKRVYTIHRAGKLGIGSAHQDGIRWAYDRGYTKLITMDCDFAHSPEYIKDFLKLANEADIVIGSRYMKEGSLKEWNLYRKILTHSGHFLTHHVLRMPYDATGAFRLYRLDRIPRGIFGLIRSQGYAFFFESLYALHMNKIKIKEFPIHLPGRTYGHSKMRFSENIKSLWTLLRTYVMPVLNKNSYIYVEAVKPEISTFVASSNAYVAGEKLNPSQTQEEWEAYWTAQNKKTKAAYDFIAVIYRTFIIRPILNHFIKKHFVQNANILHAGCGSGQVDVDVRKWIQITALDISLTAINTYRRINGKDAQVIHGDIFNIAVPDESFDGIYNLGVMEHFTPKEIEKILSEFKRVTKTNGRLVLLVPPEFGASVIFLKGVHFILNKVLKRNIQLHPAEVTRVQSLQHVREIYEQEGLKLVDHYFGIMDLFTYYVIVLEKEKQNVIVKQLQKVAS